MTSPIGIQQIVAKQPPGGSGSLIYTYPEGYAGKDYLNLGPGVFDVIVTWDGQARVSFIHRPTGNSSGQRIYSLIPTSEEVVQRRGIVRVGSESASQAIVIQSWGAADLSARATIQIIPAVVEFDLTATT